jgi:hypothetical protein
MGQKFGGNPMCDQIIIQNALKPYTKDSQNFINFTDSTSPVSKNKYLHLLVLPSLLFSAYNKIENGTKHTAT